MREWEEEQVRLDRDWYMGAEEGGLMGDEEHNPLAQYDDLTAAKQQLQLLQQPEIAKRPAVCLLPISAVCVVIDNDVRKKISAKQAQYVCVTSFFTIIAR
jgi:hypothetical protein